MICQLYPNSELIDEVVIIRNVVSVIDSKESITKDEAISSLKDRIRNVVYNYIDAERKKVSLSGFNRLEKESWLDEFVNSFLLVKHKITKVTCFRLKQYLNSNPRPVFNNWIVLKCECFISHKIMCEGFLFCRSNVLDYFFEIKDKDEKTSKKNSLKKDSNASFFKIFSKWICDNFYIIQNETRNELGIKLGAEKIKGGEKEESIYEITKHIVKSFVSDVNKKRWLINAILNIDFAYGYYEDNKDCDKESYYGYMKKYVIVKWLINMFLPPETTDKEIVETYEKYYEYEEAKHELTLPSLKSNYTPNTTTKEEQILAVLQNYEKNGKYEKKKPRCYSDGYVPELHSSVSIDDEDHQQELDSKLSITDDYEEKELQKIRLKHIQDFLKFVEPKKQLVGRYVREYFAGQTEEIYETLKPKETDLHFLTGKEKTKAEKLLPKAIEDYSTFKKIAKNKLENILLYGKYE